MESIKEKPEKSKGYGDILENNHFFAFLILLLIIPSIFGSLYLNEIFSERLPVKVEENTFETNLSGKEGSYVASKNGKTYYFPWCGIAMRIKEGNKLWFSSRIEAENAGFLPSSACHGLK